MDPELDAAVGEDLLDPHRDAVAPGVARMVGIDEQHALAAALAHQEGIAAANGNRADREAPQYDGDMFAFHVSVSGLDYEYQGI